MARAIWYISTLSFLAIAGALTLYLSTENRPDGFYLLESPRPVGLFSLRNQFGQPVNNETLKGKWHLISLGFTSCPDVCPTAMYHFSKLKTELKPEVSSVLQFTFLSVDPDRDSQEVLAKYVDFFDPTILALSGELEQIKQFSNQLGGYFVKNTVDPNTGYYSIDHSVNLILLNTDAEYVGFIQPDIPRELQVDTLNTLVGG